MYLLYSWILTDYLAAGVQSRTPKEHFIPRKIHTLSFIIAPAAHKSTSGTLYSLGENEHVHQRIRQMERKKKSHNFSGNKIPSAFPFSLSWSLVLNIRRHMHSTTPPCKSRLRGYILTWKQYKLEWLLQHRCSAFLRKLFCRARIYQVVQSAK